jgi:acyl-CoA reductase-like NAD-dependent aldehyde dehydrogenase
MAQESVPHHGVLVAGTWILDTESAPVVDKFSGRVVATVGSAGAELVDRSVTAASAASSRRPLPPRRRAEILRGAADLLETNAWEVVTDYVSETGFTLADARTELARACDTLRLSAEEAVRLTGEMVPVGSAARSEDRLAFTLRVPVGVVVAIVPFNAPLNTLVHKVGPAIAAGNAVLVKPAEATPLSAVHVCRALLEAGLPGELLSLLPGPGETTGRLLVQDPRVRYFTFTGSTAVGLFIKQHSGIAKTHLELGANSATIVCDDADLDRVTDAVAQAGFRKAGQVCTSVQRVLVDRAVADDLEQLLAARVGSLVAGDPRDADTQVGPMIAAAEAERATAWVTAASESGASVLVGGTHEAGLMRPTLLSDVPVDARVMHDEIFAPVVALHRVSGLDEAVETVNRGSYGLQAGLFTNSVERAFSAAHRLQVGGVMVNDTSSYHADLMPYGGVKNSGYGVEGPRYAVQDMTDPRIVVLNHVVPHW